MGRYHSRGALVALLVGVSALVGATSARAAQYVGEWDPAYGGIFPSLGWSASALFDVSDACLALGNVSNAPVVAGPCAGFAVLSAELRFYDVARPSVVLERFALNPRVTVIDIDITASALSSVDTAFFDAVVPTLRIAGGGGYAFSLDLEDRGLAQLACSSASRAQSGFAAALVSPSCGPSANAARGVFTAVAPPVPEPETWALMTAGLLGLGAVARRRARTRTTETETETATPTARA